MDFFRVAGDDGHADDVLTVLPEVVEGVMDFLSGGVVTEVEFMRGCGRWLDEAGDEEQRVVVVTWCKDDKWAEFVRFDNGIVVAGVETEMSFAGLLLQPWHSNIVNA